MGGADSRGILRHYYMEMQTWGKEKNLREDDGMELPDLLIEPGALDEFKSVIVGEKFFPVQITIFDRYRIYATYGRCSETV